MIKRLYNWSIEREYYKGENPCKKIEVPKFDNTVTNPLSKSDLLSLMEVLDSWENEMPVLVVKFGLYSGKRKGEILNLQWTDVDLENGFLTLKASNTKNKKSQTIPLGGKCIQVLKRCHKIRISERVFPSSTGAFYWSFNKTWRRIKKKAGINIRFHDLRHTYASYLASSGKVDIYTLKEHLGHSTIEMTQRYAHLVNGALRRASSVVDDVF